MNEGLVLESPYLVPAQDPALNRHSDLQIYSI